MALRLICPLVAMAALFTVGASGQQTTPHQRIMALVNQHSVKYIETSTAIWGYAEVGYHEDKSSLLLQRNLIEAGFRVDASVADEPTAFVASYGQGRPVIGILGEFDALPGLSQAATPKRNPVVEAAPGHGCGHNLLGSEPLLPRWHSGNTWR